MKTHSLRQFVVCFAQMLTWPGHGLLPWTLALATPALLFLRRLFARRTFSAQDTILLALLVWVVLQMLAAAYLRGGAIVITSRYLDFLSINVLLGFVFVAREFPARWRPAIAAVWLVVICIGLFQETRRQWRQAIEPGVAQKRRCEENVRAYLRTHDPAHLLNKPLFEIPYPSGPALINRLEPASIRRVLPPSVRLPVAVFGDQAESLEVLPPGLAAPPHTDILSTWGVASTTRRWRSAIQPATSLPVLRFRIVGDLGASGRTLHLVVKSAVDEVPVIPDSPPGERWKTVNIFRPSGAWWIEANDDDHDAWFAFTEPVEVGRLTWFAEKLLKHHLAVLVTGVAALLIAGIGVLVLSPGQGRRTNLPASQI